LYMSDMDGGSRLRWLSDRLNPDIMTSFRLHNCHPEPQNLSHVVLLAITV
jgi:hypothetical protein